MVINLPNELMLKIGDVRVKQIINFLFCYFESGKHEWFIDDKDDLSLFETKDLESYRDYIKKQVVQNTLYKSKKHENKTIVQVYSSVEELNALIENQISTISEVQVFKYLNGHRYTVILNGIRYELISIDAVWDFLGQPLKIILENVESDRLFIEKCLELLTENGVDKLWIEFVHGGGSDLSKVAQSINGKHRTICIIDSDVISPPNIYNTSSKERSINKIKRICESQGYLLHILNKREMENYLPDEALKHYLEQQSHNLEHIYFSFPEQCKDYFDMKKGLTIRNCNLPIWCNLKIQETEEVAATTEGKKSVVDGFGDQVWKAFHNVKSSEQLLSRDDKNELKDIAQKIVQFA
ncbi:hypothetical protein COJ07_21290 [Bacillus cereus]|uniref:hypothetical protein n=1 Tax=Bacillus cereus TaxID=1396 RepID=UPI000BF2F502|nr:hypothetical protein [Bacillus cereus]PFL17921.1 hypothetical protein COJ07_21290 [Bacillus cereus]